MEVTISERNIDYKGWKGIGYIIIDTETGAGAYKISGGANGAELMLDGEELVVGSVGLIATYIIGLFWLALLAPAVSIIFAITLQIAIFSAITLLVIAETVDPGAEKWNSGQGRIGYIVSILSNVFLGASGSVKDVAALVLTEIIGYLFGALD